MVEIGHSHFGLTGIIFLLVPNYDLMYDSIKMKKSFKMILIFFLVFSLQFSLLFCCCTDEALAQNISTTEHCHQHPQGTESQDTSHESHECLCQQPLNTLGDKSFIADLALMGFSKDLFNNAIQLVKSLDSSLIISSPALIDRSPPQLVYADAPLYLKNSILRL